MINSSFNEFNNSMESNIQKDEPDSPENIQYNEDKSIKSATLPKIIEKITTIQDTGLFYDILLTHKTFCSSIEFINALISRYERCSEQNKVVRIKIINILKTWVDKFWVDFSEDERLVSTFLKFVSALEASKQDSLFSNSLRKAYMKKNVDKVDKKDADSPVTPRLQTKETTEINNVLKIPSDQLAIQMTILEYNLYRSLESREFVESVWPQSEKKIVLPNIKVMQERFLIVSNWISTEICKTDDFKRRVQLIQYFIEVALKLKSMNNFNSLMQVMTGLNNPSVSRLKNTLSSLPPQTLASFTELQDLTQKTRNFEKILKSVHTCDPPCIPFMKIYENNLTLIKDEQDMINNNQINIMKRRKVGSVVKEISQYQVVSYNLECDETIQNYLKNLFHYDEEVNMRLSCYIEPKPGTPRGDKPVELMNTEELMKTEEDEEFELEYVEGYRFYEKDCKNNLIIEVNQGVETIKAGSIEKLVERLTYEKLLFDTSFISTFFATFRCFSTPHEILDLLIMRYNIPTIKDKSPETLLKFQKKKVTPIQLRVFNALKTWVDKYYHDFKADPTLLEKLLNFINTDMETTNPKFSQQLKASISKQSNPTIKVNMPNSRLSSVIPSEENLSKLSILDFDCEEVSRQLALILHEHYSRIQASEFSKKAWMHINNHETAPNITSFNKVLEKIGANIRIQLERCSDEKLSDNLSAWIEVIDYSRKINNWQIVVTIVKVLEQFHVSELDEVWNAIPKENITIFKEAKRYINNPGELKRFCQFAFPPVIPVLNIYLNDIANMEEKFPDMASTTKKLINFEKYKFLAETIGPLETYQRVTYSYYPVDYIRRWLLYNYTSEDIQSFQKNRFSVLLDSLKAGKQDIVSQPEKQDKPITEEEIMNLIHTKEFKYKFQFLIKEVIDDFILEMKKELVKNLDENPSIVKLKEYAKKIYNHCNYSIWRCDNSKGTSHGISYSITIDVFKDRQNVYLCDYREECDSAFILYIIQIRKLYKRLYPNSSVYCTIFTYKVSDHIREMCTKACVDLKVVE